MQSVPKRVFTHEYRALLEQFGMKASMKPELTSSTTSSASTTRSDGTVR